MIGTTEIIIISGVVVLLFGAAAIPKLARNIGKAKSEFQKGKKEAKEVKKALEKKDDSEK